MNRQKQERMKELVDLLNRAGKAYYQDAQEIMSNYEYDSLYDELVSLEKELGMTLSNSPTVNVGYQVLSEQTGLDIGDEAGLMPCVIELARAKRAYERLRSALEQVEATGYGIVMPSIDELHLEPPEVIRQGGRCGVRLEASAPSIHIIWNKKKFRTEKSTERKSIQSGVDGIHLNISTTKAAVPFGELPLLLWVGVYINQDEHMVS